MIKTSKQGLYEHLINDLNLREDDLVFLYSGYKISPFYDSMIAKIIATAPSRDECILRMNRALNELVVDGIKTNVDLHRWILEDEDFKGNNYATNYLALKMR